MSGQPIPATLEELREYLRLLRARWDADPEEGHITYDRLCNQVLKMCADGHPLAAEFAGKILAVNDWDVSWWFA